MLSLLRTRIHNNRVLRLLSNFLQGGYVQDWHYNTTLS